MRIKVPIIKQKNSLSCGPACLSMVLKFYGKDVSEDEIIENIGGLKEFGTRTIWLKEFAENLGFKTVCYSENKELSEGKAKLRNVNIDDITGFLDKDIPVIVNFKAYFIYDDEKKEIGHFVVLTGYDNNTFHLNDPRDGERRKIEKNKLISAIKSNALTSSAYLLVIQSKTI
ncbi:C39 family peptidase [Candidatus Woesearchaeota archaeon]|nr:C39 family peptidase [Candidatus Woesearchaeota archaeon]